MTAQHHWALGLLLFPLGAVLFTWAMVRTAHDCPSGRYWDGR